MIEPVYDQIYNSIHSPSILPSLSTGPKGSCTCIFGKLPSARVNHHIRANSAIYETVRPHPLSNVCSLMRSLASLTLILRTLGFHAVPLHGELTQSQRLGAFNKFKSGSCKILVATDLASRFVSPPLHSNRTLSIFLFSGLDVPSVDVVINYDSPTHSKDYIHRVGRTARAGRAGKTILMVSQYDVEAMLRLEHTLGQKFELYPTDEEEIALLAERVDEAGKVAAAQLRDEAKMKGVGGAGKRKMKVRGTREEWDRDDDAVEAGMPQVPFKRKRRS